MSMPKDLQLFKVDVKGLRLFKVYAIKGLGPKLQSRPGVEKFMHNSKNRFESL